jgi:uncharacterized membrane protein (DUF485 family)
MTGCKSRSLFESAGDEGCNSSPHAATAGHDAEPGKHPRGFFIYTPTSAFQVSISFEVSMSSLTDTQRSNARLGLWLFAIYLTLYLVFVFLSAFAAPLMERPVLAGLNLAIVYGFGLILSALVMALIYGGLCKSEPIDHPPSSHARASGPSGDDAGGELA